MMPAWFDFVVHEKEKRRIITGIKMSESTWKWAVEIFKKMGVYEEKSGRGIDSLYGLPVYFDTDVPFKEIWLIEPAVIDDFVMNPGYRWVNGAFENWRPDVAS